MKKRWELSRRHFLRGAGLTLGLPLLDAMVPSVARAQDCASGPQRLIFSFNPNGILLDRITPAASGAQWWLSGVPDSLLGLQERGLLEDVSVITNLENVHG
ncbi:MAG: transcriptional initiation protein Tat, partial [Myxococcota bacterium]